MGRIARSIVFDIVLHSNLDLSSRTFCATNMKINAIAVGGTIDKIYFDAKSKYEVGEPAVRKMLVDLPIHLEVEITPLMAKDSLEMTDADRADIVRAVESSSSDKILVTHGTDTMPETARALAAVEGKTVVLTGALAPAIFKDSDAQFNVGGALAVLQSKESGVYIVMNGQVFDALNVRKDRALNRFLPLD